MMREGSERESWERLSFQLANQAGFAGAEKVSLSDFDKYAEMNGKVKKKAKIDTKAAMSSLKSMFPSK